jgi:hypothetical protein
MAEKCSVISFQWRALGKQAATLEMEDERDDATNETADAENLRSQPQDLY